MGSAEFVSQFIQAREQAGLSQKELAKLSKISRQTITNWEGARPPKKSLPFKELNAVVAVFRARELRVTALQFLATFGYDVTTEGVRDEEEAVLLEAFHDATGPEQRAARGALGLTRELHRTELPESLRRQAARGRQDRQEIQG